MKEIATALVRAQKAFGPALKASVNPAFQRNGKGGQYADLASCINAVMDSLNDNGIALVQQNQPHPDGILVETVFIHESGEMLNCGQIFVPAAKHDPQGYGSALTYARRYSLMAACGIAPEDDDGNAATASTKAASKRDLEFKKDEPAAKPVPKAAPAPKAEAPKSDRMKSWEIKVEADDEAKWAEMVVTATNLALQSAQTPEDVQAIFQVNRATYNQMKEKFSGMYDDLLATFKQAKESF